MKTYIKGLFLTGLAATAFGCTDLDVDIESQYTEYPINEITLEAKMADIYYHFSGVLGRRYMEQMCLSSDEWTAASYGGGWYDGGAYAHPTLHNYSYEDATLDWFGTITEGISKANKAIVDLGGNDAGAAVASARAIRAFFHWIIMDGWGDVPILDRIPEDGEEVARRPRAEVAKWIESELLAAIPDLTEDVNSNTYGKPTKWMAEALLAKLYINWPVYTASAVENYDAASATNEKLADCIKVCDDIINSGKFNLGSMSYREKFSYNNGPQVEDFIYAMPYDTQNRQGMQYGRSRCWKNIKKMNPSYFGDVLSQSGGGYITLTPEFVKKTFILPGDERNKCVIGLSSNIDDYRYVEGQDVNTVYVYNKEDKLKMTNEVARVSGPESDTLKLFVNVTLATAEDATLDVGDNVNGYCQGCRSVKWYVIDDDFKNGRNQSNDVPIFRYADVLMMKAEALTRQGSSSDAKDLFNQIRKYAGAPELDHNPSLEEIYDERGREFFDENWRRNDMIRFGHYEDEYFPHYKSFPTASFDKTHRIFPIHKDILNLNPTWKQNAGY
ncbi:MAG: RagB/SusD family nutrient uptake outer membrane protein [Bacteroidales bacterium]|jgi:hypothetical protein|nr:RagB/SusD family nutrient uptake outer membrane protein [Bacteroidales bacterium]